MTKLVSTRGLRNNNPFNLRKGSSWQGLRPNQTDPAFCQFESMLYGVRAGMKLIRNYIEGRSNARKPIDTLDAIIHRFAPVNENDTEAYIRFVSGLTGLPRHQKFLWHDRRNIIALCHAITRFETGADLGVEIFTAAYDLLS